MATETIIVKGAVGDGFVSGSQLGLFPQGDSGLAGWNYRVEPPIAYAAGVGAGEDYQVVVKCYYGSGVNGSEVLNGETVAKVYLNRHCKVDFSDVRFVMVGLS